MYVWLWLPCSAELAAWLPLRKLGEEAREHPIHQRQFPRRL